MSDRVTLLSDPFPDLIISEILTRLPAKSICRFKCVSKRWNSIICHPRFVSFYVSRASPSPSSWYILNRIPRLADESTQHEATQLSLLDRPKVSTFSINPHKLVAEPVTDPARTKFPTVILHSSNGLLLLTVEINRDPHKEHAKNPTHFSWIFEEQALLVVNPVTREWLPLPKTRQPINKITQVGITTRVDPVTGLVDKFMVVEYQPIIGSSLAQLVCFSSDTGKWVVKSANYMLGMHMWRAEGSFEFDSRFFWFDLSAGLITWDAADPFADLESKKAAACRFIVLPAGRAKPFNTPGLEDERCIDVGGGIIQYLEVFKKGNSVLKLWRLKDCDSGEWTLTYKVSRDNVDRYLPSEAKKGTLKPCFVHPFEADVAYFETGDHIFSLNIRTQNVVTSASFKGHKFVIPFVLPRWPSPLPSRLYAAYAKEEGTEYFKSQEFVEAIKCYSKSIDLSPTAVAYANRAMAYLKVHNYREAEDDCSEALKLDDKYFKVYARRAKARKELGNLEGSMHDVESALKLEPNNKEMITQYAEIKSFLAKASEAESVDGRGGAAAGDPHMEIGE